MAKFKTISILLMVIGTIQIISASHSKKNSNKIEIKELYNKNSDSELKHVVLEDNLTFDINMFVKYSIEQNEHIPIESNSVLSGFVMGYEWEFNSIDTKKLNSNGKAEFTANGTLKWNLFGFTLYGESKTFKGLIE